MARGWESKSVEEQQAETNRVSWKRKLLRTPEQTSRQQEEQGLQLSRKYLLQQFEDTRDPRRRQQLELALAELEAKMARLG